MSNTKQILRLNGYSANDSGIICDSGIERFKHERIGFLRITASRDTKPAQAVIAAILDAVDEPRALTGRDRRGCGVIVLFRVDEQFISDTGGFSLAMLTNVSLALRSGEEFTLSFSSKGATIDVDAFNWVKGRSPADVPRDSLPPLRLPDFAKIASDAAWAVGARFPIELASEREADRYSAGLADGTIKVRTEAEVAEDIQAKDDAALVAAYEGADINPQDGNAGKQILDARYRHAARQRKQNAAA